MNQNVKPAIISSVFEIILTHPLDVFKTKNQQSSLTLKKFMSKDISYKYRGLVSRSIGLLPMRTIFWTSQDVAEKTIQNINVLFFSKLLFVGLTSSFFQTLVDSPIENIKISKINKQPFNLNVKSLYSGFKIHWFRNALFTTTLYSINKFSLDNKYNIFISGALGGMLGSIISQPIDYIKTNIQSGNNIGFNKYHIKNCMNGTIPRASMGLISMGIGSSVFHYFNN